MGTQVIKIPQLVKLTLTLKTSAVPATHFGSGDLLPNDERSIVIWPPKTILAQKTTLVFKQVEKSPSLHNRLLNVSLPHSNTKNFVVYM